MKTLEQTCPIPLTQYPAVQMAHGGGGRLMSQLIEKMFFAAFDNDILRQNHDAARLRLAKPTIAFTTDSFVVNPLFFPGGDIGRLSVFGTVNDLAMRGAQPEFLSVGLILEEGLRMEVLWKIVQSIASAAKEAGVRVVTGDTKVVDRGKGDGIYINTAGIGALKDDVVIEPASVRPGDAILLSGDLGRHGIAIMAKREGLEFETEIESDCANLYPLVEALMENKIRVRCLRDLTRGGLAAALNEIADASECRVSIVEEQIPVPGDVRSACEMLGLDPLHVANEGRFAAFVHPDDAERALRILRSFSIGEHAHQIGKVGARGLPGVTITTLVGAERILDRLSGEQLPRIC